MAHGQVQRLPLLLALYKEPIITIINTMNREQQNIAIELLASIGRNSQVAIESHTYGDWVNHLRDHLEDSVIDQSTKD